MKYTNEEKIGLSMAVFLAYDSYDYDGRPNSISTTGMLKSTRQIILSERASAAIAADEDASMDISTMAASSFGTAIHDGVEKAWSDNRFRKAMLKLGFKKAMIDRVVVNWGYKLNNKDQWIKDPDADPLPEGAIPVYQEIRTEKNLDGYIISGKFDFIGDGDLEDHKSTGTYGYMSGSNVEKHRMQGSIYRWLNPDLITGDHITINYVFTDWSPLKASIEKAKGYPQSRFISVRYPLMSVEDTEKWLKGKIRTVKGNLKKDEPSLPLCTKEELWQGETTYKYYKNPQKKVKSTKNFSTFAEAQSRLIKDGSVGVIDIVYAEAKACRYCNGVSICSQAAQLLADGLLTLEF